MTPHAVAAGLALFVLGCGSRGDPLEPLRPFPPPISDLRVDQRGVTAYLNFPIPVKQFLSANTAFEIVAIELLMATERYPAITADLLAVALDGERVIRMREARDANRRAREEEEQRRLAELLRIATEEALAAGEDPPTLESLGLVDPEPEEEEEEDEEEDEPLTEDEILLRRVPRPYQDAWRQSEVRPDIVLDAARRLDRAVDRLWEEVGLPEAVVDLTEPPPLPPPDDLIRAAERVARALDYTGRLEPTTFLERASVVETVEYDELQKDPLGTRAIFEHPIGIPSPGPTRTRYYFAVRTVAADKYLSTVSSVTPLAPDATPVAPPAVAATVTPRGVLVRWLPAAGDVWGELLDPDQVQYNVYRKRISDQPVSSFDRPLNAVPLKVYAFTDTTMRWGERYTYEVRPLNAPILPPDQAVDYVEPTNPTAAATDTSSSLPPRKEGAGRVTDVVFAVDTFPPPVVTGLAATRAANRITLRWTGPLPTSVAGFRIYRHEAPGPAIPVLETTIEPQVDAPGTTPTAPGAAAADAPRTTGQQAETTPPAVAGATPPAAAAASPATQDAPPGLATWTLCPPLPPVPPLAATQLPPLVPNFDPPTLLTEPEPVGGRRARMNALVRDDWEVLTATLTTQMLHIDPTASQDVSWVYLVNAVDAAGNGGPLVCVGILAGATGR